MKPSMKRKQFHITQDDERILKALAKDKGMSEAEIVREAIREYETNHVKQENPLLAMAKEAKKVTIDLPSDLSVNHDRYLLETYENEK